MLADAPGVVNHLILLDRLIARVLPLFVPSGEAVADFGHLSDLFDQVVEVEHEDHLALSVALLDELVWGQGYAVFEQIDEHLGKFFEKLGVGQVPDLHVDAVGRQVVVEG